jgi:hypothetical protein
MWLSYSQKKNSGALQQKKQKKVCEAGQAKRGKGIIIILYSLGCQYE